MFLTGWFLVGAFLGWVLSSAYSAWAAPSLRGGRITRPAVLDSHLFNSSTLRFVVAIVALLAIAALASATDHARLWSWLIEIKAIFVGLRFQALAIGVLLGLLAERRKGSLEQAVRSLGKAVVGEENKTTWPLQSAVALVLIAAAVLAVRPDLLTYLRSFKLGTFEATFADRQPLTLREAHLSLRDFREQVALVQYEQFGPVFLSPDVGRGWARELMMDKDLRDETGEITLKLISHVQPIIGSLLCHKNANALRTVTRDYDLAAYAVIWEDFLLNLHKAPLNEKDLPEFLMRLRAREHRIVKKTKKLVPNCIKEKEEKNSNDEAAAEIVKRYATAKDIMAKKGYDKPEILALTVLEPYMTGAVADLIAFISGDREKTDFLTKMLDGFPRSDDFISPGMINLYYQATESWLNSPGPLPLDRVRDMIEYATRGADLTMARSAARIAELKLAAKSPNDKTTQSIGTEDKPQTTGSRALDDPKKVTKIFDIFLRNSFATLTDEVDIYVQHVLAGETVPEGHRQSWIKAVSRLSAMLRTRLKAPTIELEGVPHFELDEFTKERLRVLKVRETDYDKKSTLETKDKMVDLIDPEFMLQADLAMALSSILLNGDKAPSAQACNTALFYVNDAAIWIEPTSVANDLDRAQVQRLKQLVAAVAARVGEPCSVTSANSQGG